MSLDHKELLGILVFWEDACCGIPVTILTTVVGTLILSWLR